MERWPPRAGPAAVALTAIGAISLLAWWYWDVEVLDAWMPNILTGLLAVAATITFVEWIVREERRRRLRPRIDSALSHLGWALGQFAAMVAMDSRQTQLVENPDARH